MKVVLTCASSTARKNRPQLDWVLIQKSVKQLQMRIAKAMKAKRMQLVKSLQWILTHSFYAKLMAIRRVVTNKGKRTPGVDGELWDTRKKQENAINHLQRRGYKALPMRRVYIKKKSGKLRPLGIPTMRDRAMQALYALALAPIAETTRDPNSYGFLQHRSCADAISQCFCSLAKRYSPKWVLEGDIESCFDRINHDWMLENIPIDRKILNAWLKAGYMERKRLYPTLAGTPQGGIISPMLANMTMDGLEAAALAVAPYRTKVNVIRYADDFVITGATRELLENRIKPAVRQFLHTRGLNLSEEKTRITRIEDGFDFLGQNLRKYNGKLLITPAKGAVKAFLSKTKAIIKDHSGKQTEAMIRKLNPIVRGWANYHRHVCSARTFSHLDQYTFRNLWRWARRRHLGKGKRWTKQHYFRTGQWIFHTRSTDGTGNPTTLDLLQTCSFKIVRHLKIRAEANPYDKAWLKYFRDRASRYRVLALQGVA